ncbi:MAG: hypothetical protein Q7V31_02885 [Parvibaculum sp.]|uniref:hypothetical protein n=1 Tax=Parvibaculum sp. TaxID=2024848 RepID=UPI00271B1F0D|nr:hypothetical protein [Parvibaculum sp.]MDO8837847.1 hypothetical protein [Parvibaculum sp.]
MMRIIGTIALIVRESSSLIFAALIWFVFWGGYAPALDTPEQTFNLAVLAGLIAIGYYSLQALAVVNQPVGQETRFLVDIMLSLVPLALVGYAAVQHFNGASELPYHLAGILWLFGTVAVADVVINTWMGLKLNKLASDMVIMK